MEIEAKIEYGNLKKLIKAMSDQYSVKVGLLSKPGENGKSGSEPVSDNIDLAGLGLVQEVGARIKVTDKMRGFFRYKFGVNLKKSTTEIEIPARSWLANPILKNNGADLRKKLIEKYGGKDEVIQHIAETGDLKSLAVLVGLSAIEQIDQAFATEGFNEWKPNSPLTIAQKGSSMPLIDNGRLRGAVTLEVEENG